MHLEHEYFYDSVSLLGFNYLFYCGLRKEHDGGPL